MVVQRFTDTLRNIIIIMLDFDRTPSTGCTPNSKASLPVHQEHRKYIYGP
jgi:hypothetical protein